MSLKSELYKKNRNTNSKEIPNYLSRSKNLSTGLDESVKPKFTRSANGKLLIFIHQRCGFKYSMV